VLRILLDVVIGPQMRWPTASSSGLSGIGAPHAEQTDELVPTITKSKERLDKIEPHVEHCASARLEAAGRAQLAKGAAAISGAIGAAVMYA
jgi:hypothetical protein